eukprot:g12523.t1
MAVGLNGLSNRPEGGAYRWGVKLGMRSVPTATACTIYHRFFRETSVGNYDPYLVAMAAMYLAGKVEEQHLKARDIINVCHRFVRT